MPETLAPPRLASPDPWMATPRKASARWTFGRKFSLWLEDSGQSLTQFADREGIPQSSLQAYTKQARKIPPARLRTIAKATRLPADYWLDEEIPYPPPVDYLNLAEEVVAALKSVPAVALQEILAMLRDPEDLRRTLAIRRAART